MPACPIVACLLGTSFRTDLQPTPQVGVGIVNQDKKPVAGKVIGPNGEATFIVLLHGCDESVKLPSKRVFMPRDNHCCQHQPQNH